MRASVSSDVNFISVRLGLLIFFKPLFLPHILNGDVVFGTDIDLRSRNLVFFRKRGHISETLLSVFFLNIPILFKNPNRVGGEHFFLIFSKLSIGVKNLVREHKVCNKM